MSSDLHCIGIGSLGSFRCRCFPYNGRRGGEAKKPSAKILLPIPIGYKRHYIIDLVSKQLDTHARARSVLWLRVGSFRCSWGVNLLPPTQLVDPAPCKASQLHILSCELAIWDWIPALIAAQSSSAAKRQPKGRNTCALIMNSRTLQDGGIGMKQQQKRHIN